MRISDWSSDVCSSDLQPEAVLQATAAEGDALSRWVAGALLADGSRDLPALLATAMQRRYSANPNERFFTGGGVHRFVNFDNDDNGRVMSVAEALRHSVNLVFVRLMRDIVSYHVAQVVASDGNPLASGSPLRQDYFSRFADREGRGRSEGHTSELQSLLRIPYPFSCWKKKR